MPEHEHSKSKFGFLSVKPKSAIRSKYWLLGSLFILLIHIFFLPKNEPLNFYILTFFCTIAIAFSVYDCFEMWSLRTNRLPRWVGLIVLLISAMIMFTLQILHNVGYFTWNRLYIEVPLALYCGLISLGAWITEWLKSAIIYSDLGGFFFVSKAKSTSLINIQITKEPKMTNQKKLNYFNLFTKICTIPAFILGCVLLVAGFAGLITELEFGFSFGFQPPLGFLLSIVGWGIIIPIILIWIKTK